MTTHDFVKSAIKNACVFSDDRVYRYVLFHAWDARRCSGLVWIGLNPSTADEQTLDPTLRRIKAFTAREGHGSFTMLNLYGYRATDPRRMFAAEDPIGPRCDDLIQDWVVASSGLVVAAWGGNADPKRAAHVVSLVKRVGGKLLCLGKNADGSPKHPLYLRADTPLVPFDVIEGEWS